MSLINKFLKSENHSIAEEIIKYLKLLLNTKQDYGSFLKDFGLADYSYTQHSSQIVETMALDIKNNFINYGGKVKLIDIQYVPSNCHSLLCFVLKCETKTKLNSFYIEFDQNKKNLKIK